MTNRNESVDLTAQNLDRLSALLQNANKQPNLVAQIPDGAHIFHGSELDPALTHANLRLAGRILLGMTLGYIETAPLVLIFERATGEQKVIDLSETLSTGQVETWVERFQEQSQRHLAARIQEKLAA